MQEGQVCLQTVLSISSLFAFFSTSLLPCITVSLALPCALWQATRRNGCGPWLCNLEGRTKGIVCRQLHSVHGHGIALCKAYFFLQVGQYRWRLHGLSGLRFSQKSCLHFLFLQVFMCFWRFARLVQLRQYRRVPTSLPAILLGKLCSQLLHVNHPSRCFLAVLCILS